MNGASVGLIMGCVCAYAVQVRRSKSVGGADVQCSHINVGTAALRQWSFRDGRCCSNNGQDAIIVSSRRSSMQASSSESYPCHPTNTTGLPLNRLEIRLGSSIRSRFPPDGLLRGVRFRERGKRVYCLMPLIERWCQPGRRAASGPQLTRNDGK